MIALLDNHKYKFVRLAALVFSCLLLGNVSLLAQATQSPVPQPNPPTPVVDNADVIDAATEQRLNNILKNLSENKAANVEMGVVTVRTTNGQDIFDYSLAVMRGWGIGLGEKGGLLLLVAIDDRKAFVQVSRHLEGDLPDGLVGQIQRERLVPLMKQGNYSQAISDTIEAYIATLAAKRGFSLEGIDQRRAYRDAEPANSGRRPILGFSKNTIIIIIVVVIFLFLSSRGGGGRGRGGCGGGGCLNMLLLNSLFNSGRGGGWGSSGWGGGGFGGGGGWGGGGGGGDWGGFSGGGGDAGGGGAGSSW